MYLGALSLKCSSQASVGNILVPTAMTSRPHCFLRSIAIVRLIGVYDNHGLAN